LISEIATSFIDRYRILSTFETPGFFGVDVIDSQALTRLIRVYMLMTLKRENDFGIWGPLLGSFVLSLTDTRLACVLVYVSMSDCKVSHTMYAATDDQVWKEEARRADFDFDLETWKEGIQTLRLREERQKEKDP
jgi:hypothetical protein